MSILVSRKKEFTSDFIKYYDDFDDIDINEFDEEQRERFSLELTDTDLNGVSVESLNKFCKREHYSKSDFSLSSDRDTLRIDLPFLWILELENDSWVDFQDAEKYYYWDKEWHTERDMKKELDLFLDSFENSRDASV